MNRVLVFAQAGGRQALLPIPWLGGGSRSSCVCHHRAIPVAAQGLADTGGLATGEAVLASGSEQYRALPGSRNPSYRPACPHQSHSKFTSSQLYYATDPTSAHEPLGTHTSHIQPDPGCDLLSSRDTCLRFWSVCLARSPVPDVAVCVVS